MSDYIVIEDAEYSTYINAIVSNDHDRLLLLPYIKRQEDAIALYPASIVNVIKIFRSNNIPYYSVTPIDETASLLDTRGYEWIAPAIFISGLMMSQNANAVSLAISMLADYLTKIMTGRKSDATARLTFYVFKGKGINMKRITYRGPVDRINTVMDAIVKVSQDKGGYDE